jgi:hypothetical protein
MINETEYEAAIAKRREIKTPQTCSACYYWRKKSNSQKYNDMWCLRYPEAVIKYSSDWCGEWKELK